MGLAPRIGNVYIATGHAMMGFWTSPMTGRLVAEELLDGAPTLDLSAVRPDRF